MMFASVFTFDVHPSGKPSVMKTPIIVRPGFLFAAVNCTMPFSAASIGVPPLGASALRDAWRFGRFPGRSAKATAGLAQVEPLQLAGREGAQDGKYSSATPTPAGALEKKFESAFTAKHHLELVPEPMLQSAPI